MNKNEAVKILQNPGLSREVIEAISVYKEEPTWMRDLRLKAFEHYISRKVPTWGRRFDRQLR
ncbi:MAG: hypothetical protein KatS3mg086_009 [Candidatus Dojkabacteria bacterium]|nr:MAG: hypothetical protein KatS3mg086_009 [Candidatus Dojkabacteria bacterium]